MKKTATRQPFFSRLLEEQGHEGQAEQKARGKGPETPGGEGPPQTMKYPSDSDEGK